MDVDVLSQQFVDTQQLLHSISSAHHFIEHQISNIEEHLVSHSILEAAASNIKMVRPTSMHRCSFNERSKTWSGV